MRTDANDIFDEIFDATRLEAEQQGYMPDAPLASQRLDYDQKREMLIQHMEDEGMDIVVRLSPSDADLSFEDLAALIAGDTLNALGGAVELDRG